ncbi:SEL1-like repeat protein [Bacillus sp. NP157]|nr:SEL1-like repeat protein [Bacillus sp. NP157]
MMSKSLLLIAACAAAGMSGFVGAAERPTPLPDQKGVVADALRPCPSSLERFLPADYYFCDAARDYWSGRDGATRESLKDAAAWASKPAQYALGIMYYNGDHAEKNRALGLAWLGLAVERHNPEYEAAFKDAYAHVSRDELAQANVYWNDLKKKYSDDVAAPRAERRFNRAYDELSYAINFGGSVFIDGVGGLPMTDGAVIADEAMGTSGFNIGRTLQSRKASVLAGWKENVYVGDAQLVPVGQVVQRSPSPTAQ